jgi:hypothetical protein
MEWTDDSQKKDNQSHQPDETFFPSPNEAELDRIEEEELGKEELDEEQLDEEDRV